VNGRLHHDVLRQMFGQVRSYLVLEKWDLVDVEKANGTVLLRRVAQA
jgi:hypothetical protein